jgi:hypothetical protein
MDIQVLQTATHPVTTAPATLAELADDLRRALAERESADDETAMEAQSRASDAARAIAGRPAETPEEFRVKAAALAFAFEELLAEGQGADAALLRSMLADLAALQ